MWERPGRPAANGFLQRIGGFVVLPIEREGSTNLRHPRAEPGDTSSSRASHASVLVVRTASAAARRALASGIRSPPAPSRTSPRNRDPPAPWPNGPTSVANGWMRCPTKSIKSFGRCGRSVEVEGIDRGHPQQIPGLGGTGFSEAASCRAGTPSARSPGNQQTFGDTGAGIDSIDLVAGIPQHVEHGLVVAPVFHRCVPTRITSTAARTSSIESPSPARNRSPPGPPSGRLGETLDFECASTHRGGLQPFKPVEQLNRFVRLSSSQKRLRLE